MLSNGASYMSPAFDIPETQRTGTAQQSFKSLETRSWDDADISAFKPERWLRSVRTEDERGVLVRDVFLPLIGPTMPFGAGVRGCYGRRLAYLEFRVVVTLMVWRFEFLEPGERYDGWGVVEGATEAPRECYVRVRELEL
jgi:cytochrome P450